MCMGPGCLSICPVYVGLGVRLSWVLASQVCLSRIRGTRMSCLSGPVPGRGWRSGTGNTTARLHQAPGGHDGHRPQAPSRRPQPRLQRRGRLRYRLAGPGRARPGLRGLGRGGAAAVLTRW